MKRFLNKLFLFTILYYDVFIINILIFVMFIIFICGCVVNPMIEPAKNFVNTVGKEYIEYVDKDESLDENAKRARRINVEAFKMLIEKAGK